MLRFAQHDIEEVACIVTPVFRPCLFLATILLVAVSCTTVTPPTDIPRKVWAPGELLPLVKQRDEQFRSLRSLARVNYSGPEGNKGFQEVILVQRPDRLRLETLSMLGAVLIVTVNDKEITGYHPRDGVFLRGERSKENLVRYTQIPLELPEITQLLLGLAPVAGRQGAEQKDNTLVFALKGGGRDVVTFGSHEPAPTLWQRFKPGGEVELSAEFSEYVQTPAGPFPAKIVFNAHDPKKRLEIRYQEPEINASLAAGLFSQQKPANVKELPIEALGG
jgi:hypothetical protein